MLQLNRWLLIKFIAVDRHNVKNILNQIWLFMWRVSLIVHKLFCNSVIFEACLCCIAVPQICLLFKPLKSGRWTYHHKVNNCSLKMLRYFYVRHWILVHGLVFKLHTCADFCNLTYCLLIVQDLFLNKFVIFMNIFMMLSFLWNWFITEA